ncbi:MAG: nucleoside-diphosphate kinase [Proteiniphilum sp.]
MQLTLVILKPSAVQRGLLGEVLSRFERKGIQIAGMKMMCLSDEILEEHYSHIKEKPFYGRVKDSMQASPVVVVALRGVDVVNTVRKLSGVTNGREAHPGTIRGDYSMSVQENIVHASDSLETAEVELARFFNKDEIHDYPRSIIQSLYAPDEY